MKAGIREGVGFRAWRGFVILTSREGGFGVFGDVWVGLHIFDSLNLSGCQPRFVLVCLWFVG